MYEFETVENIKRLIEKRIGQRVLKFIPRTPENKEMCALLEDGTQLRATSHIQMKRELEKPRKKGLLDELL